MAPPCRAVATRAPDVPAAASACRSAGVAHPAAREQLDVREAGMQLVQQRHVGSLAGADPREVEHDRLLYAGLREARERVDRVDAAQRGVGRDEASAAQVEAEHERRVRQLGLEAPERVRAGQRLGADHDPRDAQLEQSCDRRGRPRSRHPPSPAPRAPGRRRRPGFPGRPRSRRGRRRRARRGRSARAPRGSAAPGPTPRRSGCAAGGSVRDPRGPRAPRRRP